MKLKDCANNEQYRKAVNKIKSIERRADSKAVRVFKKLWNRVFR